MATKVLNQHTGTPVTKQTPLIGVCSFDVIRVQAMYMYHMYVHVIAPSAPRGMCTIMIAKEIDFKKINNTQQPDLDPL